MSEESDNPFLRKKPAAAGAIPQATEPAEPGANYAPGDLIGGFVGFLRRPKASQAGMTAQIFGENGKDADMIAALHLTDFAEMAVRITVSGIKAADGRSMKRKDGTWPVLASFDAISKRPRPSDAGQTAMFFGANGRNADAVNTLGTSSLLDALVFVDVHKAGGDTGAAPHADLSEHAERKTPAELAAIRKQQRAATEGLRLLRMNLFFREQSVWGALGGKADYATWISAQGCVAPGETPCTNRPCTPYEGGGRMTMIPLCGHHADQWDAGLAQTGTQAPEDYLQSMHIMLVQKWAEQRLRQELRIPDGFDPTPDSIYRWAVEKGIRSSLPSAFTGLIGSQ